MTSPRRPGVGQGDLHGVLETGRDADFALWDIEAPAELAYWFGRNPCDCVVRGGRVVHRSAVEKRQLTTEDAEGKRWARHDDVAPMDE